MKTRRQRSIAPPVEVAAATSDDDDEGSVTSQQPQPPPEEEETMTTIMSFAFDGKSYGTYQEMVDAKRRRNREVLLNSGLLEAKAAVDDAVLERKRSAAAAATSSRGLKRSASSSSTRRTSRAAPPPRRKSSRIAGTAAPGMYVEDERAGRFEISGGGSSFAVAEEVIKPEFYNGRVNDGSDLSVSDAVELTGSKWVKDGTVESADHFMKNTLTDVIDDLPIVSSSRSKKSRGSSPTSVTKGPSSSPGMSSKKLQSRLDSLSLDSDECVAKVVPDRIYSVACHPSPDRIIACAGDKKGYLGIWNVDQYGVPAATGGDENNASSSSSSSNDGVHLFRPHSGAISTLAWNASGTSLYSASYDGSVRAFDAEKQVFEEVFATYGDDDKYKDKVGYGTDRGYNSWIQSMELDHRFEGGKCFFLSTSQGSVIHVDARSRGKITFERELSPKKINSVSLHPNGHTMATAGLSTFVELWDVRKMETLTKKPKPVAWNCAGRSINSAVFSPSGKRLMTTTQSNTLDIMEDAHLASDVIKPTRSIKHDNQTGRWLSTFMARWHPGLYADQEMFVVGSMQQPRTIEIFGADGQLLRGIRGDALTAVASRCCFHPNANELIVVGGNGSGRVTVAR